MQTTKTFWVAAAGITIGTAGLAYTVPTGHTEGSVLGAAVLVVSAIAISVRVVLTVITDTSAEKARLTDERLTYLAAQAALESERTRIRQDLEAGARASAQQIRAERAAMRQQFEEERHAVQRHGFEVGVRLALGGGLTAEGEIPANVLPFPTRVTSPASQQNGTSLN
jgi:hypothetical protein